MGIIGERTKQRRLELGLSQPQLVSLINEVAGKAVCSQPKLGQLETGETQQPRYIFELASALGVTVDWLRGVETDLHLVSSDAHSVPCGEESRPGTGARSCVPEVDVRGGMGGGGIAIPVNRTDEWGNTTVSDDIKAQWEIPPDYLRHELRVEAAEARIIEVQGDSMEPTLRPGDRVMVNTGDRRPSPPGVFAVWDGFGVVVKRIEPIPNSDPPTLRLISDNDHHGVYERTMEEVNIIGRVVWFSRRM